MDEELDRLLQRTFEQWNIAERRIKKAEQVRGNGVVTSAIYEQRFAGPEIVDALTLALERDVADNSLHGESVRRYVDDAFEDCVKAKNDAIDAVLDFVTIWFHEIETGPGSEGVTKYFQDLNEQTSKIAGIQDLIAGSRGDRNGNRDDLCDQIERSGDDDILTLFSKMRASKDRVEAQVRRERANQSNSPDLRSPWSGRNSSGNPLVARLTHSSSARRRCLGPGR